MFIIVTYLEDKDMTFLFSFKSTCIMTRMDREVEKPFFFVDKKHSV